MASEQEIQQDIEKAISELPTPIQELIAKDEWKPWVANVVKRNNLNLDQGTVLETEIFMLMIGVSTMAEMRSHLKDEARLPESVLTAVISDVNELILDPLKQQLIDKTLSTNLETKIATEAAAPAPIEKKPEDKWLSASKPSPLIPQGALNKNSVYDPQRGIFVPAGTSIGAQPSVATPPTPPSKSNILETKLGATVSAPIIHEPVKVVTPPTGESVATATPIIPGAPKPISIDPYKEPLQ